MPIVLDDSLDPSLYPLAWLVGEWEGEGAAQLAGADGSPVGRRIEQRLTVEPNDSLGLDWHMQTWVLDAPAPEPPTSAFYEANENSAADPELDDPAASIVRELLIDERATWHTHGPLPGQDIDAAAEAKPGSDDSYVSHGVSLTVQRTTGFGPTEAEQWSGEVRGPRIQLATRDLPDPENRGRTLHAARMFGLVGGNLMWLQEVGDSLQDLKPYLSVELRRAADAPDASEAAND